MNVKIDLIYFLYKFNISTNIVDQGWVVGTNHHLDKKGTNNLKNIS